MNPSSMPWPPGLPVELEAEVQQVLHEGESVGAFVGLAVQRLVALRRARQISASVLTDAPNPGDGPPHAADDMLAQLEAWRQARECSPQGGEGPADGLSRAEGDSPLC